MHEQARDTHQRARRSFAADRCRDWDRVHRHYFPDYDERWRRAAELLRGAIGTGGRILDLGCGPGTLTARLAEDLATRHAVGVDLDPLLIEIARASHTPAGLRFAQADALSPAALRGLGDPGVPGDPEPFDAVVSSAFVHYFGPAQLETLHRACGSILAPDGMLLTVERFAPKPRDELGAETGVSQDPWEEWWRRTRAEAPKLGFTASIPPAPAETEQPPLTLEGYLDALAATGFAARSVERTPGGSTIVLASRVEAIRPEPATPATPAERREDRSR